MSLALIPDIEELVGAYLRDHPAVTALAAKVAGRTPTNTSTPWVKVTLLDAQKSPGSRPEWLINYMLQLDCYAGETAMRDFRGQAEANKLGSTVRAVLDALPEQQPNDAVVTCVIFTGHARQPDTDFEPARERVVLTAEVYAHPKQ